MKNFDNVIAETQKRIREKYPDITPERVADVINYIFDNIGTELSSLKHTGISLPNIGSFVMSPKRVEKIVTEQLESIRNTTNLTKKELNISIYEKGKSIFTKVLDYHKLVQLKRAEYIYVKYGDSRDNLNLKNNNENS